MHHTYCRSEFRERHYACFHTGHRRRRISKAFSFMAPRACAHSPFCLPCERHSKFQKRSSDEPPPLTTPASSKRSASTFRTGKTKLVSWRVERLQAVKAM